MNMGVLKNPKWEKFSQEIVRGRPAPEAYATAGFRYNRGNASRLRLNEAIKSRVAELMAFQDSRG
jgi:phage terminase small subunit